MQFFGVLSVLTFFVNDRRRGIYEMSFRFYALLHRRANVSLQSGVCISHVCRNTILQTRKSDRHYSFNSFFYHFSYLYNQSQSTILFFKCQIHILKVQYQCVEIHQYICSNIPIVIFKRLNLLLRNKNARECQFVAACHK